MALWQRLASPRPPLWVRVGQWLLPPLLVTAAVGVHWKLNVPDKLLPSDGDQGAKKKKAKKKPAKKTKRDTPRSEEQFEADYKRFGAGLFADEPVRSTWARRHQALINRAVVIARREGFEGAPEPPDVVLVDTECRSVRCRFVLRSPYRHELDVIGEALGRIETVEEPLFRSIDVSVAAVPDGEPTHEHYVQVMVGFARDRTDTRSLQLGSDEGDGDVEGDAKPEGDTPPEGDKPVLAPPARPPVAK